MTTTKSGFLTLFMFAAASAGCASASSAPSLSESEDSLTGEHFPATHCEVYVERAAPFFSSHGVTQLTLYLKTPAGKLDERGGVDEVGFHAQAIVNGEAGKFVDRLASPFPGATDYWKFTFSLQSDFSPTLQFRGAFYVKAKDGTRLWVNPTEGGIETS